MSTSSSCSGGHSAAQKTKVTLPKGFRGKVLRWEVEVGGTVKTRQRIAVMHDTRNDRCSGILAPVTGTLFSIQVPVGHQCSCERPIALIITTPPLPSKTTKPENKHNHNCRIDGGNDEHGADHSEYRRRRSRSRVHKRRSHSRSRSRQRRRGIKRNWRLQRRLTHSRSRSRQKETSLSRRKKRSRSRSRRKERSRSRRKKRRHSRSRSRQLRCERTISRERVRKQSPVSEKEKVLQSADSRVSDDERNVLKVENAKLKFFHVCESYLLLKCREKQWHAVSGLLEHIESAMSEAQLNAVGISTVWHCQDLLAERMAADGESKQRSRILLWSILGVPYVGLESVSPQIVGRRTPHCSQLAQRRPRERGRSHSRERRRRYHSGYNLADASSEMRPRNSQLSNEFVLWHRPALPNRPPPPEPIRVVVRSDANQMATGRQTPIDGGRVWLQLRYS